MAEEKPSTTHHFSLQMSSGLKERLKRCGRYHSSPLAGQKSQTRTHFNSPLLMSSDKGETRETTEKGRCELQSNMDTSNSGASVTPHDSEILEKQLTENGDLSNSEINRKPLCTSDGNIGTIPDCVKPKRLNFSEHQACDNKSSSSTGTYTADHRDSPKNGNLEKSRLQSLIKDREDILRKLKLVQYYQNKHDQNEMEVLIRKWHQVCQEGLVDLLQLMPEPKPTLTELIDHLGIDHNMISFNKEDQSFTGYVG